MSAGFPDVVGNFDKEVQPQLDLLPPVEEEGRSHSLQGRSVEPIPLDNVAEVLERTKNAYVGSKLGESLNEELSEPMQGRANVIKPSTEEIKEIGCVAKEIFPPSTYIKEPAKEGGEGKDVENKESSRRLRHIHAAMEPLVESTFKYEDARIYLSRGANGKLDIHCLSEKGIRAQFELEGRMPKRIDRIGTTYIFDELQVAEALAKENLTATEKNALKPFYEQLRTHKHSLIDNLSEQIRRERNPSARFMGKVLGLVAGVREQEAIKRVEKVISDLSPPRAFHATAEVEATYEGENRFIIDLAYSNPETGTLMVLDGASHNDKRKLPHLDMTRSMLNSLTDKIKTTKFESIEEIKDLIREEFTDLSNRLSNHAHNELKGNGDCPVFIFGQIVEIEGKKNLIVRQTSDCCMLVRKKSGECQWFSSFNPENQELGLGSIKADGTVCRGWYRDDIAVDSGDEVILFSDGLGEFMTREEFLSLCSDATISPGERLAACKEIIQQHQEKELPVEDPRGGGLSKERLRMSEQAASERDLRGFDGEIRGKYLCKIHSAKNPTYQDDISIASFFVA